MDIRSFLINRLLMLPAILIAFTFHEYAHAFIADKLGDKTPRFQGRLTLDPISHIDPIGFLAVMICGLGYAKPVQTNPAAYKNYYKDDLKVSIAGPVANLIVAFVFAIIYGICLKSLPNNLVAAIVMLIVKEVVALNCILALFNLIPIPGFDGFHVLRDLFPRKINDSLYRYQLPIFLALIMPFIPTGAGTQSIIGFILDKPSDMIMSLFMKIGTFI
ncbi:site-2 protease family protein [Clostridium felsineum]|uniref:Uncharacterized protein n=1 Tax=Clostridium felsineum TaxID=36839 RepID=A0A1S8KZ75_9CLOT|nr:site-2 protease family protein [Clostridium felsineum]URZ04182.1 hypothetical protein CLAUR_042700 [Clostridium felsineum]URZ07628.1 hypothetical protein CLROS_029670 [Clostridium felsineum]URZ12659.1 hypothetical protein CROST_033820 [Clostridium felsineum]URZ17302.1 hypothetical protein CLFE_033550 [Clostridium felsineum DSM 794]